MEYRASIIVASYNSIRTIRRCLSSLISQKFVYPFEIVVIDSSSDGTSSVIASEFPEVKLVHFPHKVLPGRARNIGINSSSGDILLFLPADCFVPPHWLSQRFQNHARGYSIVASSIDNGNPQRILGWAEFFSIYSRQMYTGQEYPKLLRNKGFLFLSYERKIFKELGPYPEKLFGNEDTVFTTRIVRSGIPIFYDPTIRFFHINDTSIINSFKHQNRHGIDAGTMVRHHDMIDSNYPCKLFLPIYFPISKWIITFYRIVRKKPSSVFLFLLLSPLIFSLLFVFSIGYYYGYYFRKK